MPFANCKKAVIKLQPNPKQANTVQPKLNVKNNDQAITIQRPTNNNPNTRRQQAHTSEQETNSKLRPNQKQVTQHANIKLTAK